MNKDITFCSPEGNKCNKRHKCYRYTCEHGEDDYVWWADYWREYGKDCKEFLEDTTRKRLEIHQLD